jgi:hypothetical protein
MNEFPKKGAFFDLLNIRNLSGLILKGYLRDIIPKKINSRASTLQFV